MGLLRLTPDSLAVLQLLALAALDGYQSASRIAIRTDSATAARLRKLRSTALASAAKVGLTVVKVVKATPLTRSMKKMTKQMLCCTVTPACLSCRVFSLATVTVMGYRS